MSAVDYRSAWDELQERLLQRDGWGTRTVIAEMADLRVKHRIPEGDVARSLRLAAQLASGETAVEPPLPAHSDGPIEDLGGRDDAGHRRAGSPV